MFYMRMIMFMVPDYCFQITENTNVFPPSFYLLLRVIYPLYGVYYYLLLFKCIGVEYAILPAEPIMTAGRLNTYQRTKQTYIIQSY